VFETLGSTVLNFLGEMGQWLSAATTVMFAKQLCFYNCFSPSVFTP